MKAMIREETVGKKRTIYRSPKKVHYHVCYEGSGKVKRYSEEEVFLYRIRAFKSSFNFKTN